MKVDMSPHSVTMRLKITSELRRLCFALGGIRLEKKLCYNRSQIDGSVREALDSATLNTPYINGIKNSKKQAVPITDYKETSG